MVSPEAGSSRLVAIKILHTAIWAFFVGCILAIPVAAVQLQWKWVVGLSAAVLGECLILAVNRGSCPLTHWASRHTPDRSPNFDIYLPAWLAANNKTIFGALFLFGEFVALWCWLR